MVGTPAYEAGVLAGDVILKIDGKATENMRMSEAVDMIQGEPGTQGRPHRPARGRQGADGHHHHPGRSSRCRRVLGDHRKPDDPKEWDYFIDKQGPASPTSA